MKKEATRRFSLLTQREKCQKRLERFRDLPLAVQKYTRHAVPPHDAEGSCSGTFIVRAAESKADY